MKYVLALMFLVLTASQSYGQWAELDRTVFIDTTSFRLVDNGTNSLTDTSLIEYKLLYTKNKVAKTNLVGSKVTVNNVKSLGSHYIKINELRENARTHPDAEYYVPRLALIDRWLERQKLEVNAKKVTSPSKNHR